MSHKDYYKLLNVERGADPDEIKKSYRKLAMKYHPDRNQDDKEAEDKFKEISEAYEVLSDVEKRKRYDQFGYDGVKGNFGSGGFNMNNFHHFDDISDLFGDGFGSIFEDLFGGGGGRSRQSGRGYVHRGRNIKIPLSLSLKDAAKGVLKKLRIKKNVLCPQCNGSRAAAGSAPKTCPKCHGQGRYSVKQGFFSFATTCDLCRGEGQIIDKYCPGCAGSGMVKQETVVEVNIPAGIDNGHRIVMETQGEPSRDGGPNGDLYVEIRLKEDELFKREGSHVYLEVPITVAQAALGADIEVPTLYGQAKLHIPSGTQPQTLLRLKGQGFSNVNGFGKGDQYVRIIIEIPRKLSSKQKELLREFDEVFPAEGLRDISTFKNKVKNWWDKLTK